jgi:hypothetical protein
VKELSESPWTISKEQAEKLKNSTYEIIREKKYGKE